MNIQLPKPNLEGKISLEECYSRIKKIRDELQDFFGKKTEFIIDSAGIIAIPK